MEFPIREDDPRHCLLIAMPQLKDPNFLRTVSVMVSFDENGAFGLIQNRQTDVTVADVLKDEISEPILKAMPVYFGGPVQLNTLWFMHGFTDCSEHSIRILEGLYLCTHMETISHIFKKHQEDSLNQLRFFLGYAGWAPSQLEQEIARGSWVMGPIDTTELFHCDSEKLWSTALQRLGIQNPGNLVSPSGGNTH